MLREACLPCQFRGATTASPYRVSRWPPAALGSGRDPNARIRRAETVRRLILFDVDGTLLSTAGLAGAALAMAMRETFGTAGPIDGFSFAGKTDPQIVLELLGAAGLPRAHVVPRLAEVFERYCERLARTLSTANTRPLAGVGALLDRLGGRPDVAVGLLTGNIRRGAAIKLSAAGLDGRFAVGAYGSDDEDRDRLVAVARARARKVWHHDFAGARTVVVGDAEGDVRCARAGGAVAVAVASGTTPRSALAALAPDVLLDSLAAPGTLEALAGVNDEGCATRCQEASPGGRATGAMEGE
jgi:phosphoglycolate phosphatase